MLYKNIKDFQIILASNSPRRQFLLHELGLNFITTPITGIEETYPEHLGKEEIPVYLAKYKSDNYRNKLGKNDILITADTIVWLDGRVIGKPNDYEEACGLLKLLSGKKHEVITGVCIRNKDKSITFKSVSSVFFRNLSEEEITYYVEKFKPYDKAGSYGIQEWIGYVGIERIDGSYYNVMGLPTQKLYTKLEMFIDNLVLA